MMRLFPAYPRLTGSRSPSRTSPRGAVKTLSGLRVSSQRTVWTCSMSPALETTQRSASSLAQHIKFPSPMP